MPRPSITACAPKARPKRRSSPASAASSACRTRPCAASMTDTVNVQAAARARRYALLGRWAGEVQARPSCSPPTISTTRPRPWSCACCAARGFPAFRASARVNRAGRPAAARLAPRRARGHRPRRRPRSGRRPEQRGRAVRPGPHPPPPRRSGVARSRAARPQRRRRWPRPRRRSNGRSSGSGDERVERPHARSGRPPRRAAAAAGAAAARGDRRGRPPRGEEVGRLLATLDGGGTATLAGVKCVGGKRWRFAPAPPRRR